MLIPENISVSNELFFDKLRLGMYNGIDLNNAIELSKGLSSTNTKTKSSASRGHLKGISVNNNQQLKQYVPYTDKNGVQKAVLVTINKEDRKGNIIYLG